MASASTRVLASPELLERILLQCEPRTLLRAMAVARYFNDQIANSPRIQQKLFFEPYEKILAYPISNGEEHVPQGLINPFLLDPCDTQIHNPIYPEDMAGNLFPGFRVNPVLWSKDIAGSASCRSMHLASPPATKVEFGITHREDPKSGRAPNWLPYSLPLRSGGMYNLFGSIEDPDGVLIGDVLNVLEDCGVAGELSTFSVQTYVEVDEDQSEQINYEGANYEAKKLIEVKAGDERLMRARFCVNVQQTESLD